MILQKAGSGGGDNTDSVWTETKTWVSTSEDRGGRAQAVKLGEILLGGTVGGIEQVKATWKRETQTDKTDMKTQRQMEPDGTRVNEWPEELNTPCWRQSQPVIAI